MVEAYDTRAEVREQVESWVPSLLNLDLPQEEVGGATGGYATEKSEEFHRKQREQMTAKVSQADPDHHRGDPGQDVPRLITKEMLHYMKKAQ